MKPETIDEIIRYSNIDNICFPQTGDCVSVAVSIKEVFGGEYVCGYQFPTDYRPAHATVNIDGVLYDGNGSTCREELYDIATSGLKNSEIQDIDEHIGSVRTLLNSDLYDQETKEKVKSRIIKTKNQYPVNF
jgi:glycine/serine hydroxymethyltransferase